MFVRVADQLSEMQRAWASFEVKVGLRGRKFYGAFDPVSATYSVCAVRLHGEPPGVYGQIGPTAERLAQRPDADVTRPTLEYYRRRDLIDVLVPIV
jgi:hypothetical protein